MACLGDVLRTMHRVQISMELFGCDPEWRVRYQEAVLKVGEAIAAEHGITAEEAGAKLPDETQLGPKAQAEYDTLLAYIEAGKPGS